MLDLLERAMYEKAEGYLFTRLLALETPEQYFKTSQRVWSMFYFVASPEHY